MVEQILRARPVGPSEPRARTAIVRIMRRNCQPAHPPAFGPWVARRKNSPYGAILAAHPARRAEKNTPYGGISGFPFGKKYPLWPDFWELLGCVSQILHKNVSFLTQITQNSLNLRQKCLIFAQFSAKSGHFYRPTIDKNAAKFIIYGPKSGILGQIMPEMASFCHKLPKNSHKLLDFGRFLSMHRLSKSLNFGTFWP